MSKGTGVVCGLVLGLSGASTSAEESSAPAPVESARDWHVGLNLRTDFGARFYRVDFGARVRCLDFIAVVDPFGLENTDYDFDGIVRREVGKQWSVFGGVRLTTVPIGRGRQWSEKALAGVSVVVPSFGIPRVRLHAGVELAVHVVSHGGNLDTHWICVDSPR